MRNDERTGQDTHSLTHSQTDTAFYSLGYYKALLIGGFSDSLELLFVTLNMLESTRI